MERYALNGTLFLDEENIFRNLCLGLQGLYVCSIHLFEIRNCGFWMFEPLCVKWLQFSLQYWDFLISRLFQLNCLTQEPNLKCVNWSKKQNLDIFLMYYIKNIKILHLAISLESIFQTVLAIDFTLPCQCQH